MAMALPNGGPQRISHEARIAAKQRVPRELSRSDHLHDVRPFAGIRRTQPPRPRQAKPHVPKQGDPSLGFLRLRLVPLVFPSPQALGLLLAILRGVSFSIVLRTEGGLVRLAPRGGAARAVEGNRNPPPDPPELAADLLHPLMQDGPQDGHQGIRPTRQGPHEALVGARDHGSEHAPVAEHGIDIRVRQVPRFRQGPQERQKNQTSRQPLGVAVRLDFCEDRFIGQQPTEGVGQMLLVAFGVATLRSVCSFPIRTLFGLLLARHGPDSFLTEVSSVGSPQGLALFSNFLPNSETPISLEKILHGVA
jgi:hypothetical protein